jgi:hypothetical protein
MHRFALSTAAFALILAGCSSTDQAGYDVADRVIQAVGAPRERVAVFDSGCERTVTIDEYGFESESIVCPDDAPPATVPADGLREGDPINADQLLAFTDPLPGFVLQPLAEAAPEGLRSELVQFDSIAAELAATCGVDLELWTTALRNAGTTARSLNDRIQADEYADYVASPPARALGRSLFEQLLIQPQCAAPGALAISAEDPRIDELLTLTADVSAAVAETDRLLTGSVMTRLFHFYSALPAYVWLRNPVAPPELVVIGSSQAGDGIDVPLLSSRANMVVGNAFLPGSLAEVQQYWIQEVFRYANPEIVVWPMGPVDLIGTCILPGRAEQFVDRLANRKKLFASSGWFSTTDPIALALGPVPDQPNLNMGNAPKASTRNAEAIAAQLPDYTNQFADPSVCSDRIDVTLEVIDQLEEWGVEAVIVGMPINPEAVELVPGGAATIEDAMAQLGAEIATTGAQFIDLSSGFDDPGLWRDLTHLRANGAKVFTGQVAEEMATRGITG